MLLAMEIIVKTKFVKKNSFEKYVLHSVVKLPIKAIVIFVLKIYEYIRII